ncbi:hypothetical protein RFI_22553, partial [Reticulomyxa filosa]
EYKAKGKFFFFLWPWSIRKDLAFIVEGGGRYVSVHDVIDVRRKLSIEPEIGVENSDLLESAVAKSEHLRVGDIIEAADSKHTENSFDSVHSTLCTIANDSAIYLRVRTMALELLLMLSVTRGMLNTLLSVLYMLLFRFAVDQSLSIRPSLVRLRRMRHEVRLDLPSQRNQTLRVSVAPAVGKPRRISIGADESFLYFHSEKGITKIGTGLNHTDPGFVAGQVRECRGNEKSSICVIGDKIYRSTNIVSVDKTIKLAGAMLEIGQVLRNGEGTYTTANNNHVYFGHNEMEGYSDASAASTSKTNDEKKPEHDKKKKEVDDSADLEATLAQARTVMDQIVENMREQLASEWDSTGNAERPEKSSEKKTKSDGICKQQKGQIGVKRASCVVEDI